MAYTYLEFEKPISDLENKIESLRENKNNVESVHDEISSLSLKIENLTKEIYQGLSIWQKVQVARHPHRPHFSDYIENIFTDFDELHGDRLFGDDQAKWSKFPCFVYEDNWRGRSSHGRASDSHSLGRGIDAPRLP